MPHFKSAAETLHFLSEEDILNGGRALLPEDAAEITDSEAESIRAAQRAAVKAAEPPSPVISPEQKLAAFLAANPDVLQLVQAAGLSSSTSS